MGWGGGAGDRRGGNPPLPSPLPPPSTPKNTPPQKKKPRVVYEDPPVWPVMLCEEVTLMDGPPAVDVCGCSGCARVDTWGGASFRPSQPCHGLAALLASRAVLRAARERSRSAGPRIRPHAFPRVVNNLYVTANSVLIAVLLAERLGFAAFKENR